MDNPIATYWKIHMERVKEALEDNNFEVYTVDRAEDARQLVLETLIPATGAQSVSFGGSVTVASTGIYKAIKQLPNLRVLDTCDWSVPREEMLERRRQSLHVDLFITSTNAVTESGVLVNLDMVGNRVAALTFGPKHVILVVGRNKITPDVEQAMHRTRNYAAPVNVMRLNKKTPCAKTAYCGDCKSPDRICNTWTITEKSFPKGRVKIVLVNEDLGF